HATRSQHGGQLARPEIAQRVGNRDGHSRYGIIVSTSMPESGASVDGRSARVERAVANRRDRLSRPTPLVFSKDMTCYIFGSQDAMRTGNRVQRTKASKILVVDDCHDSADGMGWILSTYGY